MSAARFTRLHLSNWRNFRTVDVVLQSRMFIVGPNASGKSNLLDSLRFLRDIATREGSLARAVADRGGIAHLRSLHARRESNVEIEVELEIGADKWSYALELVGTRTKPLSVEREVVHKNGEKLLDRPIDADRADAQLREQTHLEQLSQNGAFRPLVEALASTETVHVVPQVVRRGDAELGLREAPGSDFIAQMARLSDRERKALLTRIGKQVRVAVPKFSRLKVERDDVGRPHLLACYRHWRPNGGWQNEREFSDGTLRLIGVLWAIDQGTSPLLLEEPELSLHRAVIQQLPRLFAKIGERSERQILVTTHAEEILTDRGIAPGEILFVEPSDEETKVTLGSDKPRLVSAALARVSLGPLVTGITRPKEIEQLASASEKKADRALRKRPKKSEGKKIKKGARRPAR